MKSLIYFPLSLIFFPFHKLFIFYFLIVFILFFKIIKWGLGKAKGGKTKKMETSQSTLKFWPLHSIIVFELDRPI